MRTRSLRALVAVLSLSVGLLLGFSPAGAAGGVIAETLESFTPPAPIDLLAFYCAGRVASTGADPYLSEPLRTCEHDAFTEATGHHSRYPDLVVPAPLPPYALLGLEALGRLPFAAARLLVFGSIFVSWLFLAFALSRLARGFLGVFVAGGLIGVLAPSLELGQVAPLAICALAGAAWALRSGRVRLASLLVLATLLEPHLGLPAIVALFVCLPATRRLLLAGVATAALASVACGGFARNVEYLTRVLPAHARAEGLSFGGQYSLSAALAQLGAPDATALLLGSLSYVAMLIAGVLVGRLAYLRTHDPAFALVTAPAFTLLGGTYVHIHQMAAALPLAATLLGNTRQRLVPALAVLGLLIPWDMVEKFGLLGAWFTAIPPHDAHATLASVAGPDRLADDVWGAWVRADANGNRPVLELLLFKLPTWFSLAALCVLTARLRGNTRSDPIRPSRTERARPRADLRPVQIASPDRRRRGPQLR